MNEGWKIRINRPVARTGHEVFIYRELDGGKIETYDPGTTIAQTLAMGEAGVPLYFPEGTLDAMFEALQTKGFKPKDQSFVEGKLEAQTEHLEDLRHMLKLDVVTIINEKAE